MTAPLALLPPRSAAEWARALGGELRGAAPAGALSGVCAIDAPSRGAVAPCTSERWLPHARTAAREGALLLVAARLASRDELAGLAAWVHESADVALADLLDACLPREEAPVFGAGCEIHPTAVIAPNVRLGARVRVGPHSVIGQPGFGWARGATGLRHVRQLGGVVIEDDAWIGSLCTIDAGTLAPTRIGRRVKIDSQVHVGHNAEIGDDVVVCGMTGIAGSARIGHGAVIGGGVGIGDHVTVGFKAKIAGGSGVIGDVPPEAEYAGYPAMPRVRWLRAVASGLRARER
jgi:UDP-3-O-[3-hydroxymyristoyl] glucosamine N-acyltransferase